MSNDKNTGESNPANANIDEEFKPKSDDEIRQQVIIDYDLDEEEQIDLIDKVVADKVEAQKSLTTAIGQKIAQRKKVQEFEAEANKLKTMEQSKETPSEMTGIRQEIDKIKLQNLGVSDSDLLKEVKTYSRANKVSYKDALESDYVQFKKTKLEDARREQEASIGSGSGNAGRVTKDFANAKASDFDVTTPEGEKAFNAFIEYNKQKQGVPKENNRLN